MKKSIMAVLAVIFIAVNTAYANNQNDKKFRDDFYSIVQNKLGFSKTDCLDIRKAGYGPQFSLAFLYIARETGKPISEILALRNEEGYSLKDICDKYNVSYETVAGKYRADVIKYNILFPHDTHSEWKKNVKTIPRKTGGK